MTDETKDRPKPRAFPCPTEGCVGNAWAVGAHRSYSRREGGGVRRVRRCLWCNAVIETYEFEAYPDLKVHPLPVDRVFSKAVTFQFSLFQRFPRHY